VPDEKNSYVVPGLERGLRILQLFDRQHTELAAPEIAKVLGIPRSTVFRLLQTLEQMGFIEPAHGGAYRLGPAVLRLGFEYLASLEITDLARPMVEKLRDETGCSAQLAIRDGREVVIVLRAASPSAFASNVQVGTRLPAHATGYGRILLCDRSEAELRRIFPEPRLEALSAQTPKTVAELARLVREDRARGYAVSEGFFESGVSAIVVPVRDHSTEVVAAIGIALQQPALERQQRERLVQLVLRAGAELSHRLNYRPAEGAA
jgi:DNA-binding IclR family transcriptional regulator